MSSPTGSEQNYPQGGTPQGQPGFGTPPPPPQGYSPSGYGQQGYNPAPSYGGGPAMGGQKPPQVMAAAIIGIVIGGLSILSLFSIGLLFAFDAVLGLLTLLSLAAAVVLLVGGIFALQGKSPRLLLLGSYASIAAQLLTIIWALVSGWGFLFFGFLGFILPGVIIYLLMQPQTKQYYASQGISY